jgi:hypothetical protein
MMLEAISDILQFYFNFADVRTPLDLGEYAAQILISYLERFVQPRISATRSLTCSAIEGAEVNPGDSMPIRWTTDGNCESR